MNAMNITVSIKNKFDKRENISLIKDKKRIKILRVFIALNSCIEDKIKVLLKKISK